MGKNIALKMKRAARLFDRNPRSSENSDDYYFLSDCAEQAIAECKELNRSDWFSNLFEQCSELCKNGILPADDEIISFFGAGGLNGIVAGYLWLALKCVLIDFALQGVDAGDDKLFTDSVLSLRRLGEIDFDFILEKLFSAEEVLCADPSGHYTLMDSETKGRYRYAIALKSLKSGKSEIKIAEAALEKAKADGCHIGKYILDEFTKRRGYLYLIMEAVMPLAAAFAVGILTATPWIGVLSLFPAWEILRYPIEDVSLKGLIPERFPRLSVDCDCVKSVSALLTVSIILPSADKMKELEKHLEQLYLSNCTNRIKICCLADFKGADMPALPEDKVILNAATKAVDRLNRKYSGGFILAVRPRAYSKTQGNFIGRERKRGAITELVRAIKGNRKGFLLLSGDSKSLEKVRYIIALDSDTEPVFDSAAELIAVAEHPLNRPVICDGRVIEGYGILVPNAVNRLKSSKTGIFSSIMAGDRGITAYDSLSCERYQRLFGESIFCGKGLIDVDSYYELLDNSLPAESVLSHDIVEGGYLRTGFLSDVQVTESFPDSSEAFYKRLHRWVRGDWQNITFIFGDNPLGFISHYQMFDNIRRSLTSALCLTSLWVSAVIQGDSGVFLAVLSILALGARGFYPCLCSLRNGVFSAFSRLYFSDAIPVGLSNLLRGFIAIAYSAREAAVCVSAAVIALWRLLVSRKNLLEWQTAAQSESRSTVRVFSCAPALLFGTFLIAFGLPIHRLAGLIVLAEIPLTLFDGKKSKTRVKITEKQRERLLTYAAAMWNYFDDLCIEKYNFLPPDNIQLVPSKKVAVRTSPTNIGMMLVSVLAARDFGFITSDELAEKLSKSLESIEKLEKYKGNLFNWYDTTTLKTVEPRFVSTVDSGNFLCCLTALKEGLKEYKGECARIDEIIIKTERIIDSTDLSPMYNDKRNLFHVGITPDDGKKSSSFYDLYMSEARMTSYFAVASRQVPVKHWGSTGRIAVRRGRYTGLASWTGTMFEFYMPNLFLPAPKGSLSSEALCFCLYCQRKKAKGRPFGVSESAFHSFDGKMSYKYKANGVQSLSIKRGMDEDYIVSPYSSFLTLTVSPKHSMKNLSRFLKMRMYDEYGFFEAVDFTSEKNKGAFSVIRSYMAHHTGMSIISVANLLNWQCMQRRFMADSRMNGAKSLLEEKIQTEVKKTKL